MDNNISTSPDEAVGEDCIPNISPKERKKRVRFAVGQFAVTLVVLVGFIIFNINPLWRLLLFFMFSATTTSYIQALDKT